MNEREPIRIDVAARGRLVHEAADGEVGQEQAVELLLGQVGPLAPQDDPGTRTIGNVLAIAPRLM